MGDPSEKIAGGEKEQEGIQRGSGRSEVLYLTEHAIIPCTWQVFQ